MKYADHLRKQVMASICDIRDIGKRQYVAYPELASTFFHSTTAKKLGKRNISQRCFPRMVQRKDLSITRHSRQWQVSCGFGCFLISRGFLWSGMFIVNTIDKDADDI